MTYKILLADDEERIRILVSDFLKNENYTLIETKDGREAIDTFYEDPSIHLVILDVMMPYQDGYQVLSEIRKISQVPVIMLTAKNSEEDELRGFHRGADEYVTKPFRTSILVARIKSILVRTYGSLDTMELGTMVINPQKHIVSVSNIAIQLSQTEFKLLNYLVQNPDIVLSRDQILDHVWGFDYFGTPRTVDTHMNRLREKLLEAGNYIVTVRGYGYKFEVEA